MNALWLMTCLIVAAFVGSVLVGRRGQPRRGLASGSGPVLFGFLLGPTVLGLVTPALLEVFTPLAQVGLGWLALIIGLDYGWVDRRRIPVPRRVAGALAGILTMTVVAAATFALLRRLQPAPGPWWQDTTAWIEAGGIGAACAETTRHAVRWVADRVKASGVVTELLLDLADADDLGPFLVCGGTLHPRPAGRPPLGDAPRHPLGRADCPRGGDWAAQRIDGLARVPLALTLGPPLRHLDGGDGLAVRADLAVLTVGFCMGLGLSAVSRHRQAIRAAVLPAEFPLRLPALLLAGARIDVAQVPFLGPPIPLVLGARLVGKTLVAGCGALLSPPLRGPGPALIPGLMACGPTSMSIGLAFALRFPGRVGETVLVSAAAATVLGEVLSPLGLRSALRRAGEAIGTDRPASRRWRWRHERHRGTSPGREPRVELLLPPGSGRVDAPSRGPPPPRGAGATCSTALGFLLLAGTVVANVLEPLGIPHLTAYLITGMVAGPHAAHPSTTDRRRPLADQRAGPLAHRARRRCASCALDAGLGAAVACLVVHLVQNVLVLLAHGGDLLRRPAPVPPFARRAAAHRGRGGRAPLGRDGHHPQPVGHARRPLADARQGPASDFTLAFVMTSDVVVVVLLALVFTTPAPSSSRARRCRSRPSGELGHEVLGSVALGTTLGLLLVAYLRFVGRQLVLVFLALGPGDDAGPRLPALRLAPHLHHRRIRGAEPLAPGRPVPPRHRAPGGDCLRHLLRHRRSTPRPAAAREALAAGPALAVARAGCTYGAPGASPAVWRRIPPRSGAGDGPASCLRPGWRSGSRRKIQGEFPPSAPPSGDGGGHGGPERAGGPGAVQDRARPDGRVRRSSGAGGGGPGGDRLVKDWPARSRPARTDRHRARQGGVRRELRLDRAFRCGGGADGSVSCSS